MNRYLLSVRPLLDDSEYEKARKKTEEFENGIGKKLQRYVVLKSWWSSNYVSDWYVNKILKFITNFNKFNNQVGKICILKKQKPSHYLFKHLWN